MVYGILCRVIFGWRADRRTRAPGFRVSWLPVFGRSQVYHSRRAVGSPPRGSATQRPLDCPRSGVSAWVLGPSSVSGSRFLGPGFRARLFFVWVGRSADALDSAGQLCLCLRAREKDRHLRKSPELCGQSARGIQSSSWGSTEPRMTASACTKKRAAACQAPPPPPRRPISPPRAGGSYGQSTK